MTTLIQLNVTNDSPFLQNKRARHLILWLLAGAALTACGGGGNDDRPPPETATAVTQANMALAVQTDTGNMTTKALTGQAAGPGTTSITGSTDTSGTPLKYGSTYHIKNNYSGERNTYLDTRGNGCDSNWLCVSTASSNNRDRDSGSWTILSAQGKANGSAVMGGDLVYLANKYTQYSSGTLVKGPFGGFLDVRGGGCQDNALCVSTSADPNRDSGSGTWKIDGSGETIYSEQNIRLRNAYNGTYLDTRGRGCMDNILCVSTSTSSDRDSGSGTWRFEIVDIGSGGTVRHIYNMTNQTWYFATQPSRGYSRTDCPGAWTREDRVTECLVPPNTTFSFAYVSSAPIMGPVYEGWVALQSPDGVVNHWGYYGFTPYLNHNGRTTGVNLNDPADGDIQLFANMGGN